MSLLSAFILIFIITLSPSFGADLTSSDDFILDAEFLRSLPAVRIPSQLLMQKRGGFVYEDHLYTIYAQADEEEPDVWEGDGEEEPDYLQEQDEIADPFEPVNRAFFAVNDKLYFWVLKPVTKAYSFLFHEQVRRSVNNFFDNITTPVRLVNNLLQLKLKRAGKELLRFGINSTAGVLGIFDVAGDNEGITVNEDEDLGQTLGTWGLGHGFYMNLPILGPSSLRDAIGLAGDQFLDPVNYVNPIIDRYAIQAGSSVNRASFRIGEYEDIKKDALDPYAAIRDIYYQYRKSKVSR